jgi:GT2 family glycosyltransferase
MSARVLPHVCALLPAYNEAIRIGATVAALKSRREITTVVVVDDGSSDSTAEKARLAGADILVQQNNAGKGAALTTAYQAAPADAAIFLLLDADLGASAADAVKLLEALFDDQTDMTIGLLPPDPDFAATGQTGGRGFVVRLARWGIARRTGQAFAQPLSGQRGVRRSVLDAVGGKFAPGFGVEVRLTVDALQQGFRVLEVPTEFRHHVTGGDWASLRHRARQFLDVARVVLW